MKRSIKEIFIIFLFYSMVLLTSYRLPQFNILHKSHSVFYPVITPFVHRNHLMKFRIFHSSPFYSQKKIVSSDFNSLELLPDIENQLKVNPDDENLLNAKGNLLMRQITNGDTSDKTISKAKLTLERCIILNPNNEASWYQLATLYDYYDDHLSSEVGSGNTKAIEAYENVIRITNSPQVKLSCYNNMISSYIRYAALGSGMLAKAAKVCDKAIQEFPNDATIWCNTGIVLRENKSMDLAKICFEKSLQLISTLSPSSDHTSREYSNTDRRDNTDDTNGNVIETMACTNLGYIYRIQGELNRAIEYYVQAVRLDSTDTTLLEDLAQIYVENSNISLAIETYEKYIAIDPSNTEIQFQLSACKGTNDFETAPKEYISKLFDYYADYGYDTQMLDILAYNGPNLIWESFLQSMNNSPSSEVREKFFKEGVILEIGTGTGLIGIKFREEGFLGQLYGSDISNKMVSLALEVMWEDSNQQKITDADNSSNDDRKLVCPVYNDVTVKDCIEYLDENIGSRADLIIAGDVLCYIGKLDDLMLSAKKCLKPDTGRFTFTVETINHRNHTSKSKEDYVLQSTMRYAHNRKYIERLGDSVGFRSIDIKEAILRKDGNSFVHGSVVTMIA